MEIVLSFTGISKTFDGIYGTQALIKVYGVGQLTALTYVLTLGSKQRCQRSRDVGCYLGLRPRSSQSGERDPQLGITKAGNVYLRSLLIECAMAASTSPCDPNRRRACFIPAHQSAHRNTAERNMRGATQPETIPD